VSLAQRIARVFGAVYLLVGILGFIPPLVPGAIQGLLGPFEPFSGLLLGLVRRELATQRSTHSYRGGGLGLL
jgi:hypothetical protein